jgi:hypothetical protein
VYCSSYFLAVVMIDWDRCIPLDQVQPQYQAMSRAWDEEFCGERWHRD